MSTDVRIHRNRTRTAWIAAILLALSLPAIGAHAAGINDNDGDGVENAVDNCVQAANPMQRDTDLDGYGNRCDPDFNNDNTVDLLDLGALKQAFFSTAEEQDLDGSGRVDFVDLGILKSHVFGPPGPGAPDTDGDGVSLAADRCPDSPVGQVLEQGCTAFDMLRDPDRLGNSRAEGRGLVAALADISELNIVHDDIVAGLAMLDQSVARIQRGEPCEAMNDYWDGFSTLSDAAFNLSLTIDQYESQLASTPPFTVHNCNAGFPPECEFGADHTEADLVLAQYQGVAVDLDIMRQRVEERGGVLSNTCSAITGIFNRQGIVVDIDDAGRRLRIFNADANEEYDVALAHGVVVQQDVYLGRLIQATGIEYGPAGQANGLTPLDFEQPQAALNYANCSSLRIAPFQRFEPINRGPFELHHPDAYLYDNGKLRLEKGMALAMSNSVGCQDSSPDHVAHYTMHLTLQFQNANTGTQRTRVLAQATTAASQPIPLPEEILHSSDATLTVKFQRQSCPSSPNGFRTEPCSLQEVYRTEVYTLSVWDRETYCNVIYDETDFELEYVGPTEFRSTFISDRQTLLAVPDAGTQMSVVAEGFTVNAAGLSSFPSVSTIGEGQPFAIYTHDCTTQSGLLYVTGSCGTNRASGLRWPRLKGVRNGHLFSYSCSLPQVVRDLRDYCPDAPDTFYKLPFANGAPTWTMGQGNHGDFTHNGNQAFAFDFVAEEGTIIHAARRGTVTFVREDQTGNSYYNPGCEDCMPNAVTIRHEDGTVADYFHLLTNGAFVSQGQFVARGQSIGMVGNTGYSTDPHLHFHTRLPGSGVTHRSRFESLDNGQSGPPSTCWVPVRNDPLSSDN